MNPTIRPNKVLDYYDGVLVFTAEGDDGQQYIGSIIDTTDGIDRYLVKATTPERIKDLKRGKVDLRSLLLENPLDDWFLTFDGTAPDQPLELHPQCGSIETTDFLPTEGYFLDDQDAEAHERLIEKWLPINEISIEAVREGGALAGHPPVNQLHVWWARRPLIASRAAVAASLLPIDADRSRFITNIGTTSEVVTARRKMDAIKAEGGWSDISFPNDRAFKYNPDFLPNDTTEAPLVLDVTAGGGSIPFEAGRLGFRTIANELNPVASHILRATCEWPQRYGYPLLDEYGRKQSLTDAWSGIAGRYLTRVTELLEDVYPEETEPDWMVRWNEKYRDDIQKNRIVRAKRYVWAYLFARTIDCPSCQIVIPLSPNWQLDGKGNGIRVIPEPNAGRCSFEIVKTAAEQSAGTVNRAIATCPHCGATTPKGYIAAEAQQGRLGHQLYCVVLNDQWQGFTKAGKPKKRLTTQRSFRTATPADDASIQMAEYRLAELAPAWDDDDILPTEAVPIGNDQRPHTYGMEQWVKMFSPRQQLAHGYCVQAFRECVDADEEAGRLDDLRRAAWAYVAIALDKMINRNNLFNAWVPQNGTIGNAFATHDFSFTWSHTEMAITCRGLGLEWALNEVSECISAIIPMIGHTRANDQLLTADTAAGKPSSPSEILVGDARDLPLNDASVDCIVFDPPYEENVCYAELSDFFYVWLKRTAGYLFPDDFPDYLTEKDQEAISSPARFKNRATKGRSAKTLALSDYQEKMAEIFAECRRVIKDDEADKGIMTVMFNHKSTAAWDALTVSLINAGFAITRTWPVKTEAESSMHIKGKAAARTTILLVCRPREENPFPKPWHEVEGLIAQAVRDDIKDNLSQADLKPIDLYLSAFGPALRVISEHWGTERESANENRKEAPFAVTPTDALQVARREVSRHRAQEISREWANNPVDAATKFYVLAKDATENDTLLFDEANLLARAIGVRLEKNDAAMKRIVEFKSDKVSLLSARDRLAARKIGEDIQAGPALDAVHTAIALTDRRNTLDAQQWLTQHLHEPQNTEFRATLEALIRTTKPGHDDYQAQRNLWQALYGEEAPQPTVTQQPLF